MRGYVELYGPLQIEQVDFDVEPDLLISLWHPRYRVPVAATWQPCSRCSALGDLGSFFSNGFLRSEQSEIGSLGPGNGLLRNRFEVSDKVVGVV